MKRMLFVFNPRSGRRELARNLSKIIDLFTRAGYEVAVRPTSGAGDASSYIEKQGKNFDLVVCSGGDGMVSEAVNAYMRMEAPPPLGYIPSGTTNDFAMSLGLPRDIMEAARSVLSGEPRLIDVGVLGDRFFSYVAAFGQFTDIPYSTDQGAKNIFGRAAYFLEGIKQVANITSTVCTINIDGEIIEGDFVLGIITNARSVGGFRVNPAGGAAVDDGLFEAFFVRNPKNITELSDIVVTLTGLQASSDFIVQRSAKRITITQAEPCDWTVDGEFGGRYANVTAENLYRALKIIMPAAAA